MLVPILFLVAFAAALAGVVLENGLVASRTALHASVARYSDAAVGTGVADFTAGLAAFVERHGSRGPWPVNTSRSAERAVCAGAACPYRYVVTARITDTAGSDGATTGADRDAATNLQTAVIAEQRLSAVVSVTLRSAAGISLGTRTRFLTYRVFGTAPYAVVTGVRDSATVAGSQSAAQGDSGGATGVADTRIHVRLTCRTAIAGVVPFVNDQQTAGNDGLPWGNHAQGAYEAPCHTRDEPVDAFRDGRWTNGDAAASGWTP